MQVLFGRKRQDPDLLPETRLPLHFAEEVIDLEAELRLRCSLPLVKRLMELYSQAIEHYATDSNEKYLHYQDRLHSLLTRPEVQLLLEAPPKAPRLSDSSTASLETLPSPTITPVQELSIQRITEKTMNNYIHESNSGFRKLQDNLRGQDTLLANRLRKRKKMKTTVPTAPPLEVFESEFAAEVAKVMEEFVEQKLSVVEKFNKKYAEEEEALSEIGDDFLVQQVKQEIKKKKVREVEEACVPLESQKGQRIAALRKTYLGSK